MHPMIEAATRMPEEDVRGSLCEMAKPVEEFVRLLGVTLHALAVLKLADKFDATWQGFKDCSAFTGSVRATVRSAAHVVYSNESVFAWLAYPIHVRGMRNIIFLLLREDAGDTGTLIRQTVNVRELDAALQALLEVQGRPCTVAPLL